MTMNDPLIFDYWTHVILHKLYNNWSGSVEHIDWGYWWGSKDRIWWGRAAPGGKLRTFFRCLMYLIAILSVSILDSLLPLVLVLGRPALNWAKILLQSFILALSLSHAALLYCSLLFLSSILLAPDLGCACLLRLVWVLWSKMLCLGASSSSSVMFHTGSGGTWSWWWSWMWWWWSWVWLVSGNHWDPATIE